MRSERRGAIVILASRSFSLAAAVASLAALLHAIALGTEPLRMLPATLALFGLTSVLVALLRERGSVGRSTGLAVAVLAAAAWWGLSLPARAPDFLAPLARIVGFGLLGELYLWRVLAAARGTSRWHEVRDEALLALGAIALAALAGPVDPGPLPALAIAVACLGAVGLSLARSAEELALSGGQIRGRAVASPATGTAFALGILALALALALPALESAVRQFGQAAGPVVERVLFVLFLPLGYLAGALVAFGMWLRARFGFSFVPVNVPEPPFGAEADAQRVRELEEIRPFVYGAIEVIVAIVALGIAVALIARMVQDRRAIVPEGVTLEREPVERIGLRATLASLLPKRRAPRRPPADDGSRAAAVRRLYWRLLELAERDGSGWRAPHETPAEHEARLRDLAPRWREAGAVVRAFEALRYGEQDVDAGTLESAREALRRVEATA